MNEGNIVFLKAVGTMVGVNLLFNFLPPPFGLLTFAGVAIYFLWQLYKQTRY